MLGAIYIGLSGMTAYSKGLQTISNNVANLNSPGFKSTSVRFTDIFFTGGNGLSYTGGAQSQQLGSGVRYDSPLINFKDGDLRVSEGDLDLALSGAGFFLLLDGDKTLFTRTGQFAANEDGYIVLQGTEYRLAVLDGSNNAVAVNVKDKMYDAPKATTSVEFTGTLSSDSDTPTIVNNIVVYAADGSRHIWQAKFTRSAAPATNQWDVSVTEGTREVGTGTVKSISTIFDPSTTKFTINDTVTGTAVQFDLNGASPNSGISNLAVRKSDGAPLGTLVTITVSDKTGELQLTYSNATKTGAGKIAIADFRDPQTLERAGDGLFQNKGSGSYRLTSSLTDGAAEIKSKMIEASNVDLSQEFGDLILIQRGFQASSQVVSASNDMIQQLFGIRGQG